jgi:serine/threonine protein kinase
MDSNEDVLIKLGSKEKNEVIRDIDNSKTLQDTENGVPEVKCCDQENEYNVLVTNILGPSLQELFTSCSLKFSLKTVLILADQMLERLKYVHSKFLIHGNIHPSSFYMGIKDYTDVKKVFLTSFSYTRQYSKDLKIKVKCNKYKIGNLKYASLNAHEGLEQSRRDDLESLGYVLVHFVKGDLPWQNLKATSKLDLLDKIYKSKKSTSISTLCESIPTEFGLYLNYCRNLKFAEAPNYSYLTDIFRNLADKLNIQYDFTYDWEKINIKIDRYNRVH